MYKGQGRTQGEMFPRLDDNGAKTELPSKLGILSSPTSPTIAVKNKTINFKTENKKEGEKTPQRSMTKLGD